MAYEPRYARRHALQAKIESPYGSNSGGWSATDAVLLVGRPRHQIVRDLVDRNLSRPYLGGSDQLLASKRSRIEFSVELAGSGTAGVAPKYGILLRACGLSETVVASGVPRVEYLPVSAAFESVAMRFHLDGVLYTMTGCRGTAKMNLMAYDRPTIDFTFEGYDTNASESSVNVTDFTGWMRPQVVSNANSGDIKLGSAYATGAITGGTSLVSRGIGLDLGNALTHIKLVGQEAIEIDGRQVTGSMSVGLNSADEVTWRTDINTNVTTSLSFQHGVGAGNLILVHMPKVQRVNPQAEEYEGRVLMSAELRVLPSGTNGNDEMRLVAM